MAKRPRPPQRPVPLTDLQEHLRDQLGFLRQSCEAFDNGSLAEFQRMAATIRLLVHDTGRSKSLTTQLDVKSSDWLDGGYRMDETNLMSELCLAGWEMSAGISGSSVRYRPRFEIGEFDVVGPVSFDEWWSRPVLKDVHGTMLSRSDLVLIVADQGGGAHVDPEIDERYHRLTKEFSAGWSVVQGSSPGEGTAISFSPPSADTVPLEHIEKIYLRQIASEVLRTLEPIWGKIIGNRLCSCGSGRKARYCCLKSSLRS